MKVQIDKSVIERALLAIDDALIEGSFADADIRDKLESASDDLEAALSQAVEPEPDNMEEWERLAWALCAEEHGEEACTELIWEGGAIPEPWGDRWLKYEGEAKRLIALVAKHTHPAPAKPLSVEQYTEIAHRTASRYAHRPNPEFVAYTFLPHTLDDLVRKLEAAIKEQS